MITTNKKRILYIDDDMGLATLFKMRMEADGFDVTYCNDSETALRKAQEIHPDLILCDIMMPKIDGFAMLDLLRNQVGTSQAKIVMMSALSQQSDIDKAMEMGADDYIVKSQVVIEDVMNRIRSWLGSSEEKSAEPAAAN